MCPFGFVPIRSHRLSLRLLPTRHALFSGSRLMIGLHKEASIYDFTIKATCLRPTHDAMLRPRPIQTMVKLLYWRNHRPVELDAQIFGHPVAWRMWCATECE